MSVVLSLQDCGALLRWPQDPALASSPYALHAPHALLPQLLQPFPSQGCLGRCCGPRCRPRTPAPRGALSSLSTLPSRARVCSLLSPGQSPPRGACSLFSRERDSARLLGSGIGPWFPSLSHSEGSTPGPVSSQQVGARFIMVGNCSSGPGGICYLKPSEPRTI